MAAEPAAAGWASLPWAMELPELQVGETSKADDETASTKSSVPTSPLSCQDEEDDKCIECGVALSLDAPVAANGKRYCDPCWMLWGSHVCQAEIGPPYGKCHVVGSWDAWSTKSEMTWDGFQYRCHVQLRSNVTEESFQILAGKGSWDCRIYPSIPDAGPAVPHAVLGPDACGDGLNWTIRRSTAEAGQGHAVYVVAMNCSGAHGKASVQWDRAQAEGGISKEGPEAIGEHALDDAECAVAPDVFRCAECNVEVSPDASSTSDGMKYCEVCWKKALPLPVKRIQPRKVQARPSEAASHSAGLRPTFRYAGGLDLRPPLARFDVSDEACLRVGGFRHGDVVCDANAREFAVVGVRLAGGTPRLWLQPRSLGRPGAGAFPGASREVLRARLRATGRRQQLREGRAEDFDEVEDSDGEAVLLCRHCRLPVGDFAYADGEDEGALHGECLAQLVLARAREADEARLRKAMDLKRQHRAEYGLGWRPERIPGSGDLASRLGCSPRPRGLCCLVLDEDSGMVRIKETFEPSGSVNLEYLSLALQVRRSQGTEPYFSLDPVRSADALKHRMQVKRFEPEWLAGTSVGAVLFQSDYHLKELSMGEYDQPVVGMKSCFDFSEDDSREKAWNAREWFVVNKADVLLSDDNVLIPRVAMGVQAREQEEGERGLVDKPMTRPDHPLVKYAETFTKHFDLIAERRSAIFNLRELAKASVLAKFLDDTNAALEESWFKVVGTSTKGSRAEIPQLWNERCSSQVEVEDGRILDAKDGIRKGKHGVYGGVQFGLEEAVVAGAFRQPRGEPGRMLPEYMNIKLPQPSRFAAKGVDLNLGNFDLSAPAREAPKERGASWGCQSVGCDAAIGSAFWSNIDGCEERVTEEDRALLKSVFSPHLSDRRAEGERFIPPDTSASYVQSLRCLIKEEEQVRVQRKDRFLSKEFSISEPGPLFPTSWTPPFEVARRAACGAPCHLRKCPGSFPVTLQELASAPLFDRKTEDGARFRVYRHGNYEVRTIQEEDGKEAIGVVFSTSASVQVSVRKSQVREDDAVVKVTEYVRSLGQDATSDGRPSFGLYVVLESEQGAFVATEQLHDGTVTWEENPADLEDRNTLAKVVRTVDCTRAGVCIRDVKAYRSKEAYNATKSVPLSRCKRYAQGVFALAASNCCSGSGFWQRSEGLWQLLQAKTCSKEGWWQDGCWQAEWDGDWEGGWQDGWDGSWQDDWASDWQEDWQQEWGSGWHYGRHGSCPATMAAAKLPGTSPELQKANRLRQHFELQAMVGASDGQMARHFAHSVGEAKPQCTSAMTLARGGPGGMIWHRSVRGPQP